VGDGSEPLAFMRGTLLSEKGNMGQKEVDQLRALIKQRAVLLQKIKKAKGKKLEDLKQDLAEALK